MHTFGLVAEGIYDIAALEELIHRCAEGPVQIVSRQCGGNPQLIKRFSSFLDEFRYVKGGLEVNKALVVKDSDGKNPTHLIERMDDRVSGRKYPFSVKRLVIVQELEAWLLADEKALAEITHKKVSRIRNPEKVDHAKERLKQILSNARPRLTYTSEVARRIASAASLETIELRCPSFQSFRQGLTDG